MLRTVLSLIVIALLAAPSAFAAGVTGIQLDYENGNTVATIQVTGPVQISHQTVEAKDGKPFRVIVDLMSSIHQLGAMSFDDLPDCPVTTIRSSQYSVDPERVVRIVFDMNAESIYRVDAAGNQVKVYFPDQSGKPFPTWMSSGPPAKPEQQAAPMTVAKADPPKQSVEKSPAQINKKIEQDRQESLAAKPATQQPKATAPTQAQAAPAKPGEVYGPSVDPELLAKVRGEEARAKTDAAKRAEMAKAQSTPEPAKSEPTPKPQTVAATPTPPPAAMSQPTPKPEQPKPQVQPDPQPQTAASAQLEPEEEKEDAPSTARFRRSPAKSKQIAGTMVVEFPKRLTIKYKAGSQRDPFETLINDSKTNDGPVHERTPNVEALRLVGVIESPDQGNRALFEDKQGYGYILKSGDKVERGVVLRVEADRVYFQIFEYGWSRTVALRLDSE